MNIDIYILIIKTIRIYANSYCQMLVRFDNFIKSRLLCLLSLYFIIIFYLDNKLSIIKLQLCTHFLLYFFSNNFLNSNKLCIYFFYVVYNN